MTEEQVKRFNANGCIARCLLKLCEAEGSSIAMEDFCKQFELYFTNVDEKYGLLEGDNFRDVALKLPIPKTHSGSGDYDEVHSRFVPGNKRLFLLSEISLSPGATDEKKHCSIITQMDANGFSIWTPFQDGTSGPMKFDRSDWAEKQCKGLLFS